LGKDSVFPLNGTVQPERVLQSRLRSLLRTAKRLGLDGCSRLGYPERYFPAPITMQSII